MSRRISSESRSPVKKFAEYRGGDGHFEYYDKEQKKRIRLELPLRFVVLDDTRITVTGYNDAAGSGIYANEVNHLSKPLRVKIFKGGDIAEGPWKVISDRVDVKGGRFCKVVYGIMKTEVSEENPDGFEYVAFKFDGSALGPWFDFQKSTNLLDHGVEILDEFEDAKKGSTKYKIPNFRAVKLAKETIDIADRMSEPLEAYFKKYDSQNGEIESTGEGLPDVNFSGNTEPDPPSFEKNEASFRGFDEPVKESKESKETEKSEKTEETPDGVRKKGQDPDDLPF